MVKTNAYLFFWKANFMYIGKGIQTSIHDHHAVQVIIDLDEKFELRLNNGVSKKFKAVVIDSDIQHECLSGNDRMLIINIAPESLVGANLKRNKLIDAGFKSINNKLTQGYIKELSTSLQQEIDEKKLIGITEAYLYRLAETAAPYLTDERITKVIVLLKQHNWGKITIKDIAAKVFMSESRLIHLFSIQVGVPMRKYILWLRLINAVQQTFRENNITQAALDAGFSDSPHFNKTLKRMFGLNFTALKNSQIIQAYWL